MIFMHNFFARRTSMKKNKEVWIKRFQEWENSGLTRIDYCRQYQIPLSTFDYWRHRIRKESKGEKNGTGMVKLPPFTPPKKPTHFTLEYPSGHKLHIPSDYTSNGLNRLVRDLHEAIL
jgi:hypothetical protein